MIELISYFQVIGNKIIISFYTIDLHLQLFVLIVCGQIRTSNAYKTKLNDY